MIDTMQRDRIHLQKHVPVPSQIFCRDIDMCHENRNLVKQFQYYWMLHMNFNYFAVLVLSSIELEN